MKYSLILVALAVAGVFAAPVSDLAFSPDGSVLVSTAYKSIELRARSKEPRVERVECNFPRVTALAFDPKGETLTVGGGAPGEYGRAEILNWKTKEVIRRFDGYKDLVMALAIDPIGSNLAVASADHSASVVSLQSNNLPTVQLVGHSAAVLDIAFSFDGELVLTASADRSIKVWSKGGKLLRSFSHHTEMVHKLAVRLTEGGQLECVSASEDQTVRIWQPAIGRMVRIVRGHDEPLFTVAYSLDGKALFSAGRSGTVRRIDVLSDKILAEWKAHQEPIYSMAVSPDGRTLATGDWQGTVNYWQIAQE